MKRLLALILPAMLFCSIVYGQANNEATQKLLEQLSDPSATASEPNIVMFSKGVSPTTAFLLLDLKANAEGRRITGENELIEKYSLIRKNGKLYANCFIAGTPELAYEDLYMMGIMQGSRSGNIRTGLVPIDKIEAVVELSDVRYLEIGEKVHPMMDSANKLTNVDKVHAGASPLNTPYGGENVVVGIIDNGFDFTHPNFYDSTGSYYRVKRVWSHRDTTGIPPSGFNYGSEYTTTSAILAAETDYVDDNHGSHVAGIAAGSGGYVNSPYKGVAPKSELVFVGTNFSNTSIADGIQYIMDYATSVNKPCVINMSIGGHYGPHDGTSSFDQYCDGMIGPGKLLVGSAGNEGVRAQYIGYNFSNTDTLMNTFIYNSSLGQFTNDGMLWVDIWGEKNEEFLFKVALVNTTTHQIEAQSIYFSSQNPTSGNNTLQGTNNYTVNCPFFVEISPLNGKPHITMQAHNWQPTPDRKIMVSIKGQNTSIKMWGVLDNQLYNWGYPSPFITGNGSHTVGEIGGTGNSMITVGAYTSKNSWKSMSGNTHQAGWFTPVGAIAPFSSKGPTADGRTKPDIAAPGNVLMSSANSFNANFVNPNTASVVAKVTKNGKDYYFYPAQGTSMAAPMVTGIIALWLERYPNLTRSQVIELMKSTAITDNFTGNISAQGSNIWGWGKIDAFGGSHLLNNSIPAKPAYNPPIYCAEQNNILIADSGFSGYQWSSGDTLRSIVKKDSGKYAYRVRNQKGYYSPWSDSATVHPLPNATIVSLFNNVLTAAPAPSYQWYKDSTAIAGATQQTHTVVSIGNYHVEVTDSNGCSNASASIHIVPTGVETLGTNNEIKVYPNPATNSIVIAGITEQAKYNIVDLSGRVLNIGTINGQHERIDISGLSSGVYIVNLNTESDMKVIKLIKQ